MYNTKPQLEKLSLINKRWNSGKEDMSGKLQHAPTAWSRKTEPTRTKTIPFEISRRGGPEESRQAAM